MVESFGGICVLTDPECVNGTERCLEVYRKCIKKGEEYDVIVNIQGDEPFIEPEHIDLVAQIVCERRRTACAWERCADRRLTGRTWKA